MGHIENCVDIATIGYETRVFPQLLKAVGEGKLDGIEVLITRKIGLDDVVENGIKALLKEKDEQGEFLHVDLAYKQALMGPVWYLPWAVKILVHP